MLWGVAALVVGSAWAGEPPSRFRLEYDRRRLPLTAAQARAILQSAERAWEVCRSRLPGEPPSPVRLLLTPDLLGATGFALPARSGAAAIVGVRWGDLDYLGLDGEYVLTHEVAHLFSGDLAGSPLGEGIADWVAGSFGGVRLAPWWGPVLARRGLWVDPTALFVTGEYPASGEIDARLRTALYSEAALWVQYLVETYGWERFAAFARRYGPARRTLSSREFPGDVVRATPALPGRRRPPAEVPDVAAVRQAIEEAFGIAAEALFARWEEWLRTAPAPDAARAERLVLAQESYGAVRNYESWRASQRPGPSAPQEAAIRAAFVATHRARDRGELAAAWEHLAEALRLIEQVRRPQRIARPWLVTPGGAW